MIFSKEELVCFNSMLDGNVIFGTHFKVESKQDSEYVQKTVVSLKEKGFLDANNIPNALFAIAVEMLKRYKNAEKHLFINHLRVAVFEKEVIILSETDDGFDLTQVDKFLFFQSFLSGISYLCKEDTQKTEKITVTPQEWSKSLSDDMVDTDSLWAHKFTDQKMQETKILYHLDEQGFIYSPDNKILTKCGPRELRVTLMRLLEIKKPGGSSYGKSAV